MWHTVSENIIAGNAMGRRAMFQFGASLPRDAHGHVDCGMGKAIPNGTQTLLPPTQTIEQETETHVIDGVEIIFHLALESEAPSEMFMHFPGLRALNTAEIGTQSLHNLCPLRGAQVRDARLWSRYLDEALDRYAPTADVVFAQHNWPTWGNQEIRMYLRQQRDLYKPPRRNCHQCNPFPRQRCTYSWKVDVVPGSSCRVAELVGPGGYRGQCHTGLKRQ